MLPLGWQWGGSRRVSGTKSDWMLSEVWGEVRWGERLLISPGPRCKWSLSWLLLSSQSSGHRPSPASEHPDPPQGCQCCRISGPGSLSRWTVRRPSPATTGAENWNSKIVPPQKFEITFNRLTYSKLSQKRDLLTDCPNFYGFYFLLQ